MTESFGIRACSNMAVEIEIVRQSSALNTIAGLMEGSYLLHKANSERNEKDRGEGDEATGK